LDFGSGGTPHPRVFWQKSLDLPENKGFDFLRDDKEFGTDW
jgi:hypothetical protein